MAESLRVVPYAPAWRDRWDAFVEAQGGSYAHAGANLDLAALEGIPDRSLVLAQGERVRGILPLAELHEPVLRVLARRVLASGPVFAAGPLLDAALGEAAPRALALLLDAADALGRRLGADAIRIQYPPSLAGRPHAEVADRCLLERHGFAVESPQGLLLDLSGDEAALWARLTGRCRTAVRRARREGLDVARVTDRERWLALQPLYARTLGDLARSPAWFAGVWDTFVARGIARAWCAHDRGDVHAVAVAVHGRDAAYYWLGFSRGEGRITGAANLALWAAIDDARLAGRLAFELGSLDTHDPKQARISQFKASFGGRPARTWAGTRILRPARAAVLRAAQAGVAAVRGRPQPAAAGGAVAEGG